MVLLRDQKQPLTRRRIAVVRGDEMLIADLIAETLDRAYERLEVLAFALRDRTKRLFVKGPQLSNSETFSNTSVST